MSLEDAKDVILSIQQDIEKDGPPLPDVCKPALAKNSWQFECRAIRLQGFALACAKPDFVDPISALIVSAKEDDDDALLPPPESGVFRLG